MDTKTDAWAEKNPRQQISVKKFISMENLPTILRIVGASAVIVAMYSFLMKGWDSSSDLLRFLLMLGHTTALTVIGVSSGHWLKESKGARLLLTLALVSVPVNFAILGAFIYSQYTPTGIATYPFVASWSLNSMNNALFVTFGAAVLLIPITWLSFSVLARSLSKKLSLLFLLSCTVLLIPVRDPQLISLILIGLSACVIFLSFTMAHNQISTKTKEGLTAIGLQILPLCILAGRSLWLYSADLLLLTMLLIVIFIMFRQIMVFLEYGSLWRDVLEVLSAVSAMTVFFTLNESLKSQSFLPIELMLPISAMVAFMMIYDLSLRSFKRTNTYRLIAVSGLVFIVFFNIISYSSLYATLLSLIVGAGLIILGFKMKQRNVLAGGILLVGSGLVEQIYELVLHFNFGSWASMAILGIVTIVIASTIESRGGAIKMQLLVLRNKLQQWG